MSGNDFNDMELILRSNRFAQFYAPYLIEMVDLSPEDSISAARVEQLARLRAHMRENGLKFTVERVHGGRTINIDAAFQMTEEIKQEYLRTRTPTFTLANFSQIVLPYFYILSSFLSLLFGMLPKSETKTERTGMPQLPSGSQWGSARAYEDRYNNQLTATDAAIKQIHGSNIPQLAGSVANGMLLSDFVPGITSMSGIVLSLFLFGIFVYAIRRYFKTSSNRYFKEQCALNVAQHWLYTESKYRDTLVQHKPISVLPVDAGNSGSRAILRKWKYGIKCGCLSQRRTVAQQMDELANVRFLGDHRELDEGSAWNRDSEDAHPILTDAKQYKEWVDDHSKLERKHESFNESETPETVHHDTLDDRFQKLFSYDPSKSKEAEVLLSIEHEVEPTNKQFQAVTMHNPRYPQQQTHDHEEQSLQQKPFDNVSMPSSDDDQLASLKKRLQKLEDIPEAKHTQEQTPVGIANVSTSSANNPSQPTNDQTVRYTSKRKALNNDIRQLMKSSSDEPVREHLRKRKDPPISGTGKHPKK